MQVGKLKNRRAVLHDTKHPIQRDHLSSWPLIGWTLKSRDKKDYVSFCSCAEMVSTVSINTYQAIFGIWTRRAVLSIFKSSSLICSNLCCTLASPDQRKLFQKCWDLFRNIFWTSNKLQRIKEKSFYLSTFHIDHIYSSILWFSCHVNWGL